MQTRDERLKEISLLKGTRHQRKLKKYSESFNMIFKFFYLVSRKELISFCGEEVRVQFDPNGDDAKLTFRKFEDGVYRRGRIILTCHPNIIEKVLIGKKGWGLWKDQWSQGIADWSFTKEEILNEFIIRNIEIPEPFLKEFEDFIWKEKLKIRYS